MIEIILKQVEGPASCTDGRDHDYLHRLTACTLMPGLQLHIHNRKLESNSREQQPRKNDGLYLQVGVLCK